MIDSNSPWMPGTSMFCTYSSGEDFEKSSPKWPEIQAMAPSGGMHSGGRGAASGAAIVSPREPSHREPERPGSSAGGPSRHRPGGRAPLPSCGWGAWRANQWLGWNFCCNKTLVRLNFCCYNYYRMRIEFDSE